MLKFLKRLWRKIRVYIAFAAIALAAGGLAGLLSGGSMAAFEALKKPPLAPPGWLFPAAWTALYVLMGVSAGLVWRSSAGEERRDAIFLWGAQLFVNFFWTILFFVFEYRLLAAFWLMLLIALVILMITKFAKLNKTAAYLQLPYLLWLCFALYLNIGVWYLNK